MGSLADADRADLLAWCDRNAREQYAVIATFFEAFGPSKREAVEHLAARRRVWANAEALLRSVPSDRVDGALTILELWEASEGEGSPLGDAYRLIAQRLRETVDAPGDAG